MILACVNTSRAGASEVVSPILEEHTGRWQRLLSLAQVLTRREIPSEQQFPHLISLLHHIYSLERWAHCYKVEL